MVPDPNLIAVVVLVGAALLLNWRTQRTAAAAIVVAQNGSTTDRWESAVRMLAARGPDDQPCVESRLGAIYLLEQIAQEPGAQRVPALELLAAYVREHSQVGRTSLEPTTDVQAALTVLGRLGRTGIDLRRAALWGADLDGANLVEANLIQARLRGARLVGARLMRARLLAADFVGADLTGASLRGACLVGADLSASTLRGADLEGADLSGAKLRAAELQGASLVGAKLDDADFTSTALVGVDLRGAHPTPPGAPSRFAWLPFLGRRASGAPATSVTR